MNRFFFYVKFLPEKANIELLIGRCLFILHGFIKKHDLSDLGVSFPRWSESSIGSVIAFVHHDIRLLKTFKLQGYFQDMVACGFFEVSEVTQVPDTCPEVRFKRNQLIKKNNPNEIKRRLKRLRKRAEERGQIFTPNKLVAPREFDRYHLIYVQSNSTNSNAVLYIQKEQFDGECEFNQNFNSYGLATNEKCAGTIPDLSEVIG